SRLGGRGGGQRSYRRGGRWPRCGGARRRRIVERDDTLSRPGRGGRWRHRLLDRCGRARDRQTAADFDLVVGRFQVIGGDDRLLRDMILDCELAERLAALDRDLAVWHLTLLPWHRGHRVRPDRAWPGRTHGWPTRGVGNAGHAALH